jgi:hypothetical protein
MIRKKIREFLRDEMKKDFPSWDFSLTPEILPRTDTVKVNLFFPEEKFHVFAESPRVFESHLTSEIELAMAFVKEKPAMERELAQVMWWVEKNRFLGKLVLNSQIEQIETWEDYNGDQPLAFCRISLRCVTHQNLLEAS